MRKSPKMGVLLYAYTNLDTADVSDLNVSFSFSIQSRTLVCRSERFTLLFGSVYLPHNEQINEFEDVSAVIIVSTGKTTRSVRPAKG